MPHDDEVSNGDGRRERTGRPRLVALGFLLAFAATVLTVLMTGLLLRG